MIFPHPRYKLMLSFYYTLCCDKTTQPTPRGKPFNGMWGTIRYEYIYIYKTDIYIYNGGRQEPPTVTKRQLRR